MIKVTLIALIGAGVIGTGAHKIQPEALEMTTGSAVVEISSQGFDVKMADTPDFAITLRMKDARRFTVRL